MLSQIFRIACVVLFGSLSAAQVLSPSGYEVAYVYQAEFVDLNNDKPEALARHHGSHMFGIFHSPKLVAHYGLNPNRLEGIGAPRSDIEVRVLGTQKLNNGRILIRYAQRGKLLLQKNIAAMALKKGQFDLILPYDMTQIYNRKCTDTEWPGPEDYWYYYDPFRKGCEYLANPPYANPVTMKITPAVQRQLDPTPRLDLLRGANGNGDDFVIYEIEGFSDYAQYRRDLGRRNYKQFEEYLQKKGFDRQILRNDPVRPLALHTKSLQLANGRTINIKLYHLLVETSIEARTVTFAKFFKQAIAEADVIVYGGHSGLGDNLNIPALEEKAGRITFNPKKRQLFFFDACASYAYYLPTFSAEKTRARIDVVTYGLSSLYETGPAVLQVFMNVLFDPTIEDKPWMEILQEMERPLRGSTYLLNVGGI